ncbi:proteinase B [Savitreella phatthalungensis]
MRLNRISFILCLLLQAACHDIIHRTRSWALERISLQRERPNMQIQRAREELGLDAFHYLYESLAKGVGSHVYILGSGIACDADFFDGHAHCSPAADVRSFSHIRSLTGKSPSSLDTKGDSTATCVASVVGHSSIGVSPNATIHSVKILSGTSHYARTSSIIKGIEYVITRQRLGHHSVLPILVNTLMMTRNGQGAIQTAFDQAISAKVVVVSSAGVEQKDASYLIPHENPGVIVVGGTTIKDEWWQPSNHGPTVTLLAPAERVPVNMVVRTGPKRSITIEVSSYSSSTLLAASLVAGTLANWQSYRTIREVPNLTPARLKALLLAQTNPDRIDNVPSNTVNKLLFARPPEYPAGTAAAAA